jgi:hypothetical protein
MMFFSSIMQKSPDTGFKFSVTCVLLPYYLLSPINLDSNLQPFPWNFPWKIMSIFHQIHLLLQKNITLTIKVGSKDAKKVLLLFKYAC